MPLDPQAKQVMEQLAALGFPPRIRCPQSKPASMPKRAPGLPGQRSPGSNSATFPVLALLFRCASTPPPGLAPSLSWCGFTAVAG